MNGLDVFLDIFLNVYFLSLLAIIVIVLIVVAIGLKRVLEFERLVVFSASGKYKGTRGPGITWVKPWEKVQPYETDPETGKTIKLAFDMREQTYDVKEQDCITKDSVPVTIQPIVFLKIVDPAKTALTVENAKIAILNIAKTTLRAVIGDMELTEVIARREHIAQQLRNRLAREAERWGVDVTTVEIADLKPRKEVEDAMAHRKATIEKAEADRRSAIMKAEGQKEAALSEKEALITRSEADKQAAIARAEGQKEAKILEAEGLEIYYQKLAELGKKAEIVLQFESIAALKKFAESENEKLVILPLESAGAFSFAGLKFLEESLPSKRKKSE